MLLFVETKFQDVEDNETDADKSGIMMCISKITFSYYDNFSIDLENVLDVNDGMISSYQWSEYLTYCFLLQE